MASELHPSFDRLRDFALGQVEEAELTHIESHLNDCPSCCELLLQAPDDGFVDSLRSADQQRSAARLSGDSSEGERVTASTKAVPGYEILAECGRGGMGVVYQARQLGLNRLVALKMLLAGVHASPRDLARFRLEAETIALLRDAGIVQIFEIGMHDGLPFFAMEYVEGGTLADLMATTRFTARQAAELIERVARAVQAAHEQGIIHRDLKPSNILMESTVQWAKLGTRPTEHQPKIADFGLARWLKDDAALTRTGLGAGTPAYMAPEQARSTGRELGPAVDVYALGAMLYELLTGRPPFQGATSLETLQQVIHQEPTSPRQLRPGAPRDLDTICLKCLEKKPARRYASAADLAEDLRRHLNGDPITARPVHEIERAWLWSRRNPLVACLLLAVLLSLVGGAAVSSFFAIQASGRAQEALEAAQLEQKLRQAADTRLYAARMAMALHAWSDSDVARARDLLEACRPAEGERDLRAWEWHYVNRLCQTELMRLLGYDGTVFCIAYSPDGKLLASAGGGNLYFRTQRNIQPGKVYVRSAATGQVLQSFVDFKHLTTTLAFSRDGKLLAMGCHDGTIEVRNLETGQEISRLRSPGNSVTYLSFSATGSKLFSVSGTIREGFGEGGIRIWDLATGAVSATAAIGVPVRSADWSPDNRWICFSADGKTCLLDARTMQSVWQFNERDPLVWKIAFSPDGNLVASAGADGRITLLVTSTGKLFKTLGPHIGPVRHAAFSPDGKLLAAAGNTPEVRFWDVDSGEIVRTIRGPTSIIETLAFAPSGHRLATGDHSGTIKIWDAGADQRGRLYSKGIYSAGSELRFALGGESVLDVFGALWRVDDIQVASGTAQIRQMLPADNKPHYYVTAVSPDGQWLAGVDNSKANDLHLWNTSTKQLRHLSGPSGQVSCVRFAADGSWFAASYLQARDPGSTPETGAGRYGYEVVVWDVASGKPLQTLAGAEREYPGMPRIENGASLALSPDGVLIAQAGFRQPIRIWNRLTQKLLKEIALEDAWCRSLTFSADGQRLAGQYVNRCLKVWNVADWSERCQMTLATHECALALSPDGGRLASSDMWGKIQLWETETGMPVFELRGLGPAFGTMGIRAQVAFDDSGLRLASFNNNDTTNIFDATPQPVVVVGP